MPTALSSITSLVALLVIPAVGICNNLGTGELALADIHTPDAVSAWPPAVGWWLLLMLVAMVVAGLIIGIKRYRQHWGYRRAALALLNTHYQQWQQYQLKNNQAVNEQQTQETRVSGQHQHDCATAMVQVLKRTVRTAYGNDKAALYGDAWVQFLNQQTKKNYINEDIAQWMQEQQYRPSNHGDKDDITTVPIPALYRASVHWIKKHRIKKKGGKDATC